MILKKSLALWIWRQDQPDQHTFRKRNVLIIYTVFNLSLLKQLFWLQSLTHYPTNCTTSMNWYHWSLVYSLNVKVWISTYSFKELNAGQHDLKWQNTLKLVIIDFVIAISTLFFFDWLIHRIHTLFLREKISIWKGVLGLTPSLDFPLVNIHARSLQLQKANTTYSKFQCFCLWFTQGSEID